MENMALDLFTCRRKEEDNKNVELESVIKLRWMG
jgi:hypothetical protein